MISSPKRGSQPIADESTSTSLTHQWSASLQTVLDQPLPSLPSRLALGGTLFFLAFGAWAWFGQIDEVAIASGKLIPKGEVYKIHPVELGKVVNVAVKEGQTVKAGQLVVELDSDIAAKEVERLEKLLLSTRIELVQVESMFQQNRLQAETQAAIAEAAIQEQKVVINQTQLTAENAQAILGQLEEDATAQQQRLERLQPLKEAGAIPVDRLFEGEQMLRDRQRSITEAQGTLDKTHVETKRLQVGLSERIANAKQMQLEAQQKLKELEVKLTELQSRYNETQVLLETAQAKLKQRYLYAPVSGVVLTLNVPRAGEVVQAGQAIAEVAPLGKPLVISAILPSYEAGFVKPGMPVQIKHGSYPYQDYGIIPGQVMTMSPDSKPDQQLGQVYRLEIKLHQTHIKTKEKSIQFKPGQTVTAEIVTRRRRIFDVIFDPLKKLQGNINL